MLEAYRIGVVVSLTNRVSGALGIIARDFSRTDAAALRLNQTLRETRLLMATGLVAGTAGYLGVRLFSDVIKPANAYAHQLNILNMAGLQHAEIAEAVTAAWKNTSTVITTTATDNLKSILDLRNVLGDMGEAKMALPIVTRIQAVLASSSESGVRKVAADNFSFSMAKALDIVGAARSPADFEKQATAMAKVITAFQGRVNPQMFQSVFAYARQAKFGLGDEFKYELLPSLMLEYAQGSASQGGGSRGVGPSLAAFSRLVLQGYINKKSMPELERLGLIRPGASLRTTTSGTTTGPMVGAALARENPYEWVQQVALPAIMHRLGPNATQNQLIAEIQEITRGNQLASQLILEFALKQKNFLRDQAIIQGAMAPDRAYLSAMRHDPNFAYAALAASWGNLETAFGKGVVPLMVPVIVDLTRALNDLARWADRNQALAGTITGLVGALSGFLLLGGALAIARVALRGFGTLFGAGGLSAATMGTATAQVAGMAGAAGELGTATGAASAAIGVGGAGLIGRMGMLARGAGVLGVSLLAAYEIAQVIKARRYDELRQNLTTERQQQQLESFEGQPFMTKLLGKIEWTWARIFGASETEAWDRSYGHLLHTSEHEGGPDWPMYAWQRTMQRPLALPLSLADTGRTPWAPKAWDLGKGPLFGTELPGARFGNLAQFGHLAELDRSSPFSTRAMKGIAESFQASQGDRGVERLIAKVEQFIGKLEAATRDKVIHLESNLLLDGRVLARSVEDVLSDAANRPFAGPSSPDYSRTYPSPAAPGGGN